MSILLKPKTLRGKRVFRREWGCPRTKNRTPWCFGMCTPVDGKGECGRIAPHSLRGRTDKAIYHYLRRKSAV